VSCGLKHCNRNGFYRQAHLGAVSRRATTCTLSSMTAITGRFLAKSGPAGQWGLSTEKGTRSGILPYRGIAPTAMRFKIFDLQNLG